MKTRLFRLISGVALMLAACLADARSDEVAVKGRSILEAHKGSVVTVMLVVKQRITFPGSPSRDRESKSETTGTVISPDGLTVLSLSQTDPSSIMETMMAGSGRSSGMQMETEIRDVQILLEDGTEVPAEIILRDKDLDMAFARPLEKPTEPFEHVDLSEAAEPDYLDQVIALNRMGRVAGRTYSVSVERIEAIVRRPRTFYIPGKDPTNTGLGSPAFTLDGKFIGVFLIRAIKSTGGARSGQGGNITTMLLPAMDIADAAEQAPPFED